MANDSSPPVPPSGSSSDLPSGGGGGGASEPTVSPLSDGAAEWLQAHRDGLGPIVEAAGIEMSDDDTILHVGDSLVNWWHGLAEEGRPDADSIVNCLAVAMGDALAENLPLQWVVFEDVDETDICLFNEEKQVLISPRQTMAGGFAEGREGIFSELFEAMFQRVSEILSGESGPAADPADDEEGGATRN